MAQTAGRKHNLSKGDVARIAVPVAIVTVLTLILLMPMIRLASTEGAVEELTDSIRQVGPVSGLIIVFMQMVKSVAAFVPAIIVYVIAGMVLGPLWGSIAILVGAFLGTLLIYALVRKFGAPVVHKMIPASTQDKFDFIQRSSHVDAIVFIMFLIPGLPKDVFAYLISLTDIDRRKYFALSTVGRAPSVFVTCFAGATLIEQNWLLLIVLSIAIIPVFIVTLVKSDVLIAKLDQLADAVIKGNERKAGGKEAASIAADAIAAGTYDTASIDGSTSADVTALLDDGIPEGVDPDVVRTFGIEMGRIDANVRKARQDVEQVGSGRR